ncbi:acyl-CoA dehydrogenase family protein [uncultured Mycobacterium sp.]|uniref:acyl-CoA dehydrogenase family protein n=1 Tax=uncultured Mycobacterium sp. TaxID=171292 RepID=UPI0035CAF421
MVATDTCRIVDAFEDALLASADRLAELRTPSGNLAAQLADSRRLMNWLFDGGWVRWGWPQEVGGFGGSSIIRCEILERLALHGYDIPHHLQVLEVVGPAVVSHAPQLAAAVLPAALRGDELWCQGFSEPEAGSDLAALRTSATLRGDGGFMINGQRVWTSYGAHADRMVLLARTGPVSDRHRGLVMLLVDLDSPGVERRPIALAGGREELAECFFTDAVVGADRLIGEVGAGWSVAMDLLQYERGTYAWLRMAMCSNRLQELLRTTGVNPWDTTTYAVAGSAVGQAYLSLAALRARTSSTLRRLAAHEIVGEQTSVDKLLLSTAEQDVLDASMALLGTDVLIGDGSKSQRWRDEWWYSRAASIYGGAREIQHSIIADRVLKLPREGTVGR